MTEPAKDETRREATKASAPKAREARRGRLAWAVAGFLLVLVAAGGAWITWPLWNQSIPGWLRYVLAPAMEAGRYPGLVVRVEAVEKRLESLSGEVAALRDRVASISRPDGARLDALAAALKALEDKAAARDAALDGLGDWMKRIDSLNDRLRAVEAAVAALAARPPPAAAGADAAALTQARAETAALKAATEAAVQRLEKQNRALAEALAQTRGRLARLEKEAPTAAAAARAGALLLAVGQLREATRGSAPFAPALSAVRALMGAEAPDRETAEALETLARHAAAGVPHPAALRARLAAAAGSIARSTPAEAEGGGWWDRALGRVASLIRVRRTGPSAAARDDAEGRVARAEMALGAGDLAGAVAALEGLQEPAATAAAPWLSAARARLAVDAAVATLESAAVRRLGTGPHG